MVLGLSTGPVGWVIAFSAGMLSFLSPCVLPMVPGYLSLMSGVRVTEVASGTAMATATATHTDTRSDTRTMLRATLLFVAGFTVVFTALGATASAIGSALSEHQMALNRVAGVVVIVMGLFLAGMVSPRLLQQERRFHVSPSKLGTFAAPVMGMAFAFGWTPCIGSVLAPILTYAAADGTVGTGVVLLVFYSLGLGVPFVASGVALGRLAGAFDWVKRHFRAINVTSGLLLASFGVLLLTNRVGRLSGWVLENMDRLGLDFLTTS